MMNFRRLLILSVASAMAFPLLTACSDSDENQGLGELTPAEEVFGKANDVFSAEEWYPGGQLGTTEKASYSADAPAVDLIPGGNGASDFITGEDLFEHLYTFEQAPRKGLGPAWLRNSCIACHPSYGHGKRQTDYRTNTIGNGYLLVIYHPTSGTELNVKGEIVKYNANSYISHVTGMPQTAAMSPFKAPIDENQIKIDWKTVTEMETDEIASAGNGKWKFADGETFELIYPEVTIPQAAFNVSPRPDNYEVRLEGTIGIYGTGLLDAITDEDMEEQWRSEAKAGVDLNPAMWDASSNAFAPTAYYSAGYNDTGKHRGSHGPVKRFTYAMTRGTLQDGAGANAIWNITNVTRSDRHWFYTTPHWAKAMSEDNEVIDYISKHGADESSLLHPYYASSKEGIAEKVNDLLSISSIAGKEKFENAFVKGAPYNGEEEMSDKQFYQFMVWHRGLAVPAARNLDDAEVKKGKQLFMQIGCQYCHRPSWKTGSDDYWVDAASKAYAQSAGIPVSECLPKFAHQTIWPYTDMVQHKLFMKNDIRTGWCRTTPLWGRGLSLQLTGAEDRLHDYRARNEVEAIMWHAYSKQSHAYNSAMKFYKLGKSDRDAVVKFLRAI